MTSWRIIQLSVFAYTVCELPYRWAFTRHSNPATYSDDYATIIIVDRGESTNIFCLGS